MALYNFGFGSDSETLYRDGKRVGGIEYCDMMDTCMWWFVDPCGFAHYDNYADPNMTPADLQRMVMFAYEDKED
jgi:hypothetical protein